MGIRENLAEVEENIRAACEKAGRDRSEVTLIAVSKTKPVEMLMEAYEAGIRDFGENKVQELKDKYDKLPKDIRWHMIGHLQRNKVKDAISRASLIHGVDSYRLAEEISHQAIKQDREADILLEVNIGEEESKFGVPYNEVEDLVYKIISLPKIRVQGLMCIAPNVLNPEENRPLFQRMRKKVVDIKEVMLHNKVGIAFTKGILSMGMTGDYQVAVEEGATMVRVGTGIFGARESVI
ncbi:MAG: YggS family pyridoxal phosphate-dependent enzyme [Lachnospiraceae bacterium]|nr:YggS family pyridoxal phosphate-dependent enzyme [Lachnospiraceae bacterium]